MLFLRKFFIIFPLITFFYNHSSIAEVNNGDETKLKYDYQTNINLSKKKEYILGTGDGIIIRFLSLDSELGGEYIIGPEGFVNFRGIGNIYVSGFTTDELKNHILPLYAEFVINPVFDVFISKYKSISIFVNGEVADPGLYQLSTFSGSTSGSEFVPTTMGNTKFFPTLFDAIKAAGGITNYSDLENITIIRKNSISNGGGLKKAKINLLPLFIDGDQRLNIDLFDGDSVIIGKSDVVLKDQFIKIARTNLNPKNISVFVSGNVTEPGLKVLPKGSGLIQAISVAGGRKRFSGTIEFLRFTKDGKSFKREFKFDSNSDLNSYENPILIAGDIIRVNESIFGSVKGVIQEFTTPIANTYGLYKIFGGK